MNLTVTIGSDYSILAQQYYRMAPMGKAESKLSGRGEELERSEEGKAPEPREVEKQAARKQQQRKISNERQASLVKRRQSQERASSAR